MVLGLALQLILDRVPLGAPLFSVNAGSVVHVRLASHVHAMRHLIALPGQEVFFIGVFLVVVVCCSPPSYVGVARFLK